MTFQAYNVEQMKSILKTRLKGVEVIEDGAIEFAARKVRRCEEFERGRERDWEMRLSF